MFFYRVYRKLFNILSQQLSAKTKVSESILLDARNAAVNINVEINQADDKSLKAWKHNWSEFKELILSKDVHSFCQSDIVNRTMFLEAPLEEFSHLKKSNFDFFKFALTDIFIGNPPKYYLYPKGNGNTVHHLFSISQLVSSIEDLKCYDRIIEFGGGYGNMCRCFRSLGFQQKYVIFDFPIMNILQKLYLNANDIFNIDFISSVDDLLTTMKDKSQKTLFVGTWSISEAPIELRNSIFACGSDAYIIAFQKKFEGIDNLAYFEKLSKKHKYSKIIQIEHLPGHFYFVNKSAE